MYTPGLLESAYQKCLYYELQKLELSGVKQATLPLIYVEVKLEVGYRVDILNEKKFIVEIKSVEAPNDPHLTQILTYHKLAGCKPGILINCNNVLLKDGIKRVINGSL
jgi:GxxExxY protein